MNNILNQELNKIIDELKNYFSFEENKIEDFNLQVAKNEATLLSYINYLEEIKLFQETKSFSFTTIINLKEIFASISKGSIISAQEIYEINNLLDLTSNFHKSFKSENKLKQISFDASSLTLYPDLITKIRKKILPDYNIADDASLALSNIRKEKKLIIKKIEDSFSYYKNKYQEYLSEDVIAYKNNFYSLPFKYNYKNSVEGSIVSYSESNKTAYVIPLNIIKMQNELNEIINNENNEIFNILKELTSDIKKHITEIKNNYYILKNLDRFFASYNYGLSYHGCIGKLDNKIELNDLFHPLLNAQKIITNSFLLDKNNKSMLFLSGPNAGGKSVLLKATSLAIMMFKLGLLLPCLNHSCLPYIDKVFLITGDNQSIENNLSTFSSHINLIKDTLNEASEFSFIAIDEICEGTSPSDGEALSYAIIKYINDKNIYSLITSHFDLLKLYAQSSQKILVACMEFSSNNLVPTFHLILNEVSNSYGIELALKSGINKQIIDDALVNKKNQLNYSYEKLNKELSSSINENKILKQKLDIKEKKLDELTKKKEIALENLNKEKEAIHNKANQKINKEINKKLEQLNNIFDSGIIDIPLNKQIEIKTAIKRLNDNIPLVNKKKEEKVELNIGDYVLDENNQTYLVIRKKKDQAVLISNGLKILRSISGLRKTSYIPKKEKKDYSFTIKIDDLTSSSVLNVIGLNVDDALKEYQIFLSKALSRKIHTVKIIHGVGSYKLKNALWDFLSSQKDIVSNYRIGYESEGGLGATIIELK